MVFEEGIAACGDDDGVENDGDMGKEVESTMHGVYDLSIGEHSDFDGVYGDVTREVLGLGGDHVTGDGHSFAYALSILSGKSGDDGCSESIEGGEGFEVCLNSGPATGV